jgi:DNA mismatch repair protein MutL
MKGMALGMSRKERVIATIACHSTVMLGDKLYRRKKEALIEEWLSSRYPATCPRGRSICYRIDRKDLARKQDRHWLLSTSARTRLGATYIQTVRTAHRVNC